MELRKVGDIDYCLQSDCESCKYRFRCFTDKHITCPLECISISKAGSIYLYMETPLPNEDLAVDIREELKKVYDAKSKAEY